VSLLSEAAGHVNPVFLGVSPPGQARTRTVSQIMTRQSSETGRHLLLSDPGTPLSPPAHGVVFFPEQGKTQDITHRHAHTYTQDITHIHARMHEFSCTHTCRHTLWYYFHKQHV
jgi:hypothetical protein